MLYIITAVHNRMNTTKTFVQNYMKQNGVEKHLVLIDDGSTDGTKEMVKEIVKDVTLIEGDGNLWWGGALNLAYNWICANTNDYDHILFVNDDIIFDKTYFEKGISLLGEYKNTLIAGCGYSINDNKLCDSAFTYDYRTAKLIGTLDANGEGNCASTRSLFMSVADMKEVGGFKPKMLPHYFSDYEWTLRASRKGFSIRSFDDLKYFFEVDYVTNNKYSMKDLKKIFTIKSNINPIYRINFILLSTPVKYLPSSLYFQMKRYITNILWILKKR